MRLLKHLLNAYDNIDNLILYVSEKNKLIASPWLVLTVMLALSIFLFWISVISAIELKTALLYIVLDICEVYRDALLFLFGKIGPDGVFAFDQYLKPLYARKWPGSAKAIIEFLGTRGLCDCLQSCALTENRYLENPNHVF